MFLKLPYFHILWDALKLYKPVFCVQSTLEKEQTQFFERKWCSRDWIGQNMGVIGRIQGENWPKLQQEEIDPDSVLASLAMLWYIHTFSYAFHWIYTLNWQTQWVDLVLNPLDLLLLMLTSCVKFKFPTLWLSWSWFMMIVTYILWKLPDAMRKMNQL